MSHFAYPLLARAIAEGVILQIWYCLGVDSAGYPTNLIDCPSGSQLGTCDANKCANSTVLIPAYDPSAVSAASTG
jgi:hypothetical protein